MEQSTNVERALLGSVLLDNSVWLKTASVGADDFLLDSHRLLYSRMAAMIDAGRPCDLITVTNELAQFGQLERCGGPAYVASLIEHAFPENCLAYVTAIRRMAVDRNLARRIDQLQKTSEGSLPAKLADIQRQAQDLLDSINQLPGTETLGHSYDEIINARDVTFAIDGFLQEEGITLIGGLSGHGKTLLMLSMARALLEGTKLFHRFTVTAPSQKVIYLIPECGLTPFAHRLKLFGLPDYVKEGRLICRTLSKKPIGLNDPNLLREVPGADVFLDTVTRFKSGDENDAGENAEFAENLFRLQRAGARTITGAHHSPKSFGKDTYMTLENILRGTGDIGAMLCACWGVRQIDAERNRIYIQSVKSRDFQPCEPFIIQGRPSLDTAGTFELTESPGFAGELNDHLARPEKGGRPAVDHSKAVEARRLQGEGKSYRQIAKTLGVSHGTVGNLLAEELQ